MLSAARRGRRPPTHSWATSDDKEFIPKALRYGLCLLNMQEGWWRLYRRDALAGRTFADAQEIERATKLATVQLNRSAKPWIWEQPPKDPR